MYYEINISLHGKHFFATAERSISDKAKLIEVYKVFAEKFPMSEGYLITVSKNSITGEYLDMKGLLVDYKA